ncbi:plasmid segregation protein ParM domain-containing protein [Comamonas thiooxydans]|uniref:ParM/StbA family protein n=1 Tax=Comamonas thiooxydans TaxID=363952 RepID=UPI000AF0C47A|nr:plasmid segregation protein ParM domain-containing protein [Comamonas thiooxydans]
MEKNGQFLIDNAAADIGYFSTKIASKANGKINTLAFPSQCARVVGDQIISVGMSSLSGVNVNVEGSSYFVGPDSALQTTGRESRTISENFVETPEYLALYKGALHYILRDYSSQIVGHNKVTIKRLVAGLPLNTFSEKKDKVRSLLEGIHVVPSPSGDDIEVNVRSVTVIPQPQGALINAGAKLPKTEMGEFYKQNLLVIDLGGGTCDWLLSNNRKFISARSGAYQKGVLACVYAICEPINKSFMNDPLVIKRIDDALCGDKKSFKLNGHEYLMADYKKYAKHILNECLNQVLTSVGSLTSVDMIIFTGGGGKLLFECAKEAWEQHQQVMSADENPVFSIVTGMHQIGEVLNA